MIRACILAAGASSRLGEPKALARIDRTTALAGLVAALRTGLGDATPTVVTGAHHDAIVEHIAATGLEVEVLHNPLWMRGRTGSVATAARAHADQDLLLAPIDVPLIQASTIRALAATWQSLAFPATGWLAPRLHERSGFGHPVVLGRQLVARSLDLAPNVPLYTLRDEADPLDSVRVDDPAILDDLDTPEDLARMRAR